jgi:hypothetical protein
VELSLKDVCRKAQAALAASSVAALRRVRVEVADDALLLCGLVASFYHKQLAQEAIRLIVGEYPLVNAVAVQ